MHRSARRNNQITPALATINMKHFELQIIKLKWNYSLTLPGLKADTGTIAATAITVAATDSNISAKATAANITTETAAATGTVQILLLLVYAIK